MSDTATLIDAIRKNNFGEAISIIENNQAIAKSINDYERTQIFEKVISAKAFELIPALLDSKIIETDVYEYDSFNKSIFESIVRYLKDDELSIQFLDDFLSGLENISDEVQDQTLISYAIEEGADIAVLKSLVNAGCDVNYKDNAEQTFLHQITSNNRIKPEKALAYLEFMIEQGLDVNAQDIVQKTALSNALSKSKTTLIDVLLQNGASANLPDNTGESAFFQSVTHLMDLNLYMKLREYEAPELNHVNVEEVTLLFDYLRKLNRCTANEIRFVTQLIEDGADLMQPSIYYGKEKMPLDLVAEQSFDIFNAVIDLDVIDVNTVYNDGNTLLHKVAAFNIYGDKEKAKDTYRKVKLLMEKGVDVTLSNSQDQTALALASDDNLKIKTVEILLTAAKS